MAQADTIQDPKCLTDEEVNLFLDWKQGRLERIIKLDDLCDDIKTRNSEYGEVLLSSKRKSIFGNVSALVSTLAAPFSGGLSLIGVTGSVGLFVRSAWNDYRAKGNLGVVIKEADKLLNQEEALLGKVIAIVNRLQYDDDTDLAKACDFVEIYTEYGSDDADSIPEIRVHDDLLGMCQPPSVLAIGAANIYKSAECVKSAEEGARVVSDTANAARKARECAKVIIGISRAFQNSGGLNIAVDGPKALAEATYVVNQATEGIKTTGEGVKYFTATAKAVRKATDGVKLIAEHIKSASETASVVRKAGEAVKTFEEGTKAVAGTAKVAQEAINVGQKATEGVIASGACVQKATQAIQKSANAGQLVKEGLHVSIAGKGVIAVSLTVQNAAGAGHMAAEGASIAQSTANVTLQNVTTKLASVSKFGLTLNAIFIPFSIFQLIRHEHPDKHPKIQEIRGKIIGLLQELTEYSNLFTKCLGNVSQS